MLIPIVGQGSLVFSCRVMTISTLFNEGKWLRGKKVLSPLGGRFENLETAHECLVNAHHCPGVIELSEVIRSGEEGDQLTSGKEFVTILNDLVGSADQVEVVLVEEFRHDVRSEGVGHTPVVLTPTGNVLVGVGPQKVAKEARVGDVGRPHDPTNLLKRFKLGGKPSVHAEDFFVHDGSDGECVETVGEGLPQFYAVSTFTLIVKAVDSVNGRAFVVAPEQEEILWVFYLVRKKEADGLQTLLSSIDVVAEEEVVRFRREAAILKKAKKVVVLAVHVSDNLDGGLQLKQDGLGNENVPRFVTKESDL